MENSSLRSQQQTDVPVQPIQHLADGGDHQIEWFEYPPAPGAPPALPLVLVHGFTHSAGCFAAHWAPYAAAQGVPTFTIDLSGRFGSTAAKSVRQLLPADFVRDIRLVVEAAHLGEQVVLLGHSMGGLLVQMYVHQHPVGGLILAGTLSYPEHWRAGSRATVQAMARCRPHLMALFYLWPQLLARDPKIARTFFIDPDASPAALKVYQNQLCLDSCKALFAAPSVPFQPLQTRNVLFIAAKQDCVVPLNLMQKSAAGRGAPCVVVDSAHDLMLTRTWQEPIDQILSYLRRWSAEVLLSRA